MAPIREYDHWAERQSDSLDQVEPLRRYVFICEGQNSEVYYFRALIDRWRRLDLHPLVDLRLWEKTGEDVGISRPLALMRFAHLMKAQDSLGFREDRDRLVIVFDLDVYCRVGEGRKGVEEVSCEFNDLLEEKEPGDILAFTNPSFELFLLLHKENSFESAIAPNAQLLIENRMVRKRRFAEKLFSDVFHMNPKTNARVGDLVDKLDIAVDQESRLNQSIDKCLSELTSNVGATINSIRSDRLEF